MKAVFKRVVLVGLLASLALRVSGQVWIKFDNLATNSGLFLYYTNLLCQDVNFQVYAGPAGSLQLLHTWLLSDGSARGINVAPGRFAESDAG